MAYIWTKEKLESLTLTELNNVKNNIKNSRDSSQIEMVDSEISKRKPKPKVPPNAPAGFEPIIRSVLTKKLELDAVDLLEKLGKGLLASYDFSSETAYSISEGSKGFRYVSLLSPKSKAKTGGIHRKGYVAFERYISFNIKSDMYGLDAVLFEGGNERNVKYLVIGPKSLLPNAKSLADVSYLFELDVKKDKIRDCEEFDNFEAAANRFKWLIDQVVPKLKK